MVNVAIKVLKSINEMYIIYNVLHTLIDFNLIRNMFYLRRRIYSVLFTKSIHIIIL